MMRARLIVVFAIFAAISCDHDITTPSIQQSGSFTVDGAPIRWFSASKDFLVLVRRNANTQYFVERRTLTGDLEWTYAVPTVESASAAVIDDQGNIYFSTSAGPTSLSSAGVVRWHVDLPYANSIAIGDDGRVYVATNAFFNPTSSSDVPAKYYALNAQTGATVWSMSSTTNSGAIVVDRQIGTVYFAAKGGATAVNSSTGAVRWTYLENGFAGSAAALGPDGTLYVSYEQDMSRSLNAISSSGVRKWRYTLAPSPGGVGPLVDADGNIYVSAGSSTSESAGRGLVSLSPAGTLRWSYDFLQRVGDGVLDANNTIYLTSHPLTGPDVGLVAIRDGNVVSTEASVGEPFLDPYGRVLYWKTASQVNYFMSAGYNSKAWAEYGGRPQRTSSGPLP